MRLAPARSVSPETANFPRHFEESLKPRAPPREEFTRAIIAGVGRLGSSSRNRGGDAPADKDAQVGELEWNWKGGRAFIGPDDEPGAGEK